MTVMPTKADVNLAESMVDKTKADAARIPMAPAIVIRVLAFREFCMASRLPVIPSRTSFSPPTMPPAPSVTPESSPMNFLIASPIPATRPTLKISVRVSKLMLVMKSEKAFVAALTALLTCMPKSKNTGIKYPMILSTCLPNAANPSDKGLNLAIIRLNESPRKEKSSLESASEMPANPFDKSMPDNADTTVRITPTIPPRNSSKNFPCLSAASRATRKSPSDPVMPRIPDPTGAVAPASPNNAETMADMTCPTMLMIAKKPLKVRFRFSASTELSLRPFDNSRRVLLMSASCWPVIGGMISRIASPNSVTICITPLNAFRIVSMMAVRPPRSFQL